MPWLGVEILKINAATDNDGNVTHATKLAGKNWIGQVARNSPASQAGMKGSFLDPLTTRFRYGEAIVAINGRLVPTFAELQSYLEQCAVGEQLSVTLEDETGARRVVYLTLQERPASDSK